MSRLHDQQARLYLSPPEALEGSAAGTPAVRTLVVGLCRPADWSVLVQLWRGVQADLEWPAPGIAVDGGDGMALWFSLAEPVSLEQARACLAGLVARYLPDVKPERLSLWPSLSSDSPAALSTRLPPQQTGPQRWSAFVAPDLAAVFADEPALDLPPGDEAQADQLARLSSIPVAAFHSALVRFTPAVAMPEPEVSSGALGMAAPQPGPAGPFEDPRDFLREVMNDARVPMAQRIEAAKALLAFAAGRPPTSA
jgi:hypothetical protein